MLNGETDSRGYVMTVVVHAAVLRSDVGKIDTVPLI